MRLFDVPSEQHSRREQLGQRGRRHVARRDEPPNPPVALGAADRDGDVGDVLAQHRDRSIERDGRVEPAREEPGQLGDERERSGAQLVLALALESLAGVGDVHEAHSVVVRAADRQLSGHDLATASQKVRERSRRAGRGQRVARRSLVEVHHDREKRLPVDGAQQAFSGRVARDDAGLRVERHEGGRERVERRLHGPTV